MKRIVLYPLLICTIALMFGGCSARPASNQEGIFISGVAEAGKQYALSCEDERIISALLEEGDWDADGTSDCASDCVITMPDGNIYYHSSCGTFNDGKNSRSLTLKGDKKAIVDSIFEKYIQLGGFIPPKAK